VNITYWGFGLTIKKQIAEFNRTHPHINVTLKEVSGDEYQQLLNALKAGTAPDVGQLDYADLPSFRLVNGLRDISACPGVAQIKDKVVPWTWSQVTFGGSGVYAIPQNVAPLGLYYRKDVFAKYGLPVPKTWADYYTVAKTLRAKDPSAHISSFSSGDALLLMGLMWQNGSRPFKYEGNSLAVNLLENQSRQVMDYWQKMVDEHLVDSGVQLFTPAASKKLDDGSLATVIAADWFRAYLPLNAPKAKGKWAVASLPQWDTSKVAGANFGGGTAAVLAGSKHPAEAAEFAAWLTTSDTAQREMIAQGGTTAAVAGQQRPEIDDAFPYYGGQRILHTFVDAAKTVDPRFQWPPNWATAKASLGDALTSALNGKGTIASDFQQAQSKIIADLKSRGVDVKAG
jgi:multiple sugar transport system substrate-binding protein